MFTFNNFSRDVPFDNVLFVCCLDQSKVFQGFVQTAALITFVIFIVRVVGNFSNDDRCRLVWNFSLKNILIEKLIRSKYGTKKVRKLEVRIQNHTWCVRWSETRFFFKCYRKNEPSVEIGMMILGRHSFFFISFNFVSYFISILPYFLLATITERVHVSDNLIETTARSQNFQNFEFEVEIEVRISRILFSKSKSKLRAVLDREKKECYYSEYAYSYAKTPNSTIRFTLFTIIVTCEFSTFSSPTVTSWTFCDDSGFSSAGGIVMISSIFGEVGFVLLFVEKIFLLRLKQ